MSTPEWALELGKVGWAGEGDSPPALLFNSWAGLLCSVVEMQNALRQDYSLQRGVGLSRESEEPRSPYLLDRNVDTYQRFLTHYLRPLSDAVTDRLWPAITAAFPDAAPAALLRQRMARIWAGDAAAAATALPDVLRASLTMAVSGDIALHRAEFCRIQASCQKLAVACADFLGEIKRLLRGGLLLLERSLADLPTTSTHPVIALATGAELAAIAEQIPGVLGSWLMQVAAQGLPEPSFNDYSPCRISPGPRTIG